VEGETFDLPGLIQTHGALGERFNFGFGKNEGATQSISLDKMSH
jgi:hypothetical protein